LESKVVDRGREEKGQKVFMGKKEKKRKKRRRKEIPRRK